MFETLLVPVDGSDYSRSAVETAIEMAKRCGSTLHGLHVVDIRLLEGPFLRDLSSSMGFVPYSDYQSSVSQALEERGKVCLDSFSSECEKAGVPFETKLLTGTVVSKICDEAELADLVVIGKKGENAKYSDDALGSTVERVVRRSEKPMLLTAEKLRELRKLLLAYDGSQHARNAMSVGALLAGQWEAEVQVLSVFDEEETREKVCREARQYLCEHKVNFSMEIRGGDPDTVIPEFAKEIGADIVVMGAYGHSRVREWILGSTTERVLNQVPCPVLLTR